MLLKIKTKQGAKKKLKFSYNLKRYTTSNTANSKIDKAKITSNKSNKCDDFEL